MPSRITVRLTANSPQSSVSVGTRDPAGYSPLTMRRSIVRTNTEPVPSGSTPLA